MHLAQQFVSNQSLTCWFMSPELVQPMSGSISRAASCSNCRSQRCDFARPDCVAVFAGQLMRANILVFLICEPANPAADGRGSRI